ncbi:MAG: GAF domain-containing protein, partial [Bdellovibrionaceae bacterium]|nr:GAF domain-containing protein [Pseudobdellovibrionaceae bacterium]
TVAPLGDLPASSVIQVLAKPENLQVWWSKLQTEGNPKSKPIDEPPVAIGSGDQIVLQEDASDPEENPDANSQESELLEIKETAPAPNLDFTNIRLAFRGTPVENKSEAVKSSAPKMSPPPVPQAPPRPPTEEPQTFSGLVDNGDGTQTSIKPILSDEGFDLTLQFREDDELSAITRNGVVKAPAQAQVSQPLPQPEGEKASTHPDYPLQTIAKHQAGFIQRVEKTFTALRTHFTRSYLLASDNDEGKFLPIQWEGGATPNTVSPIPLERPSIFRIVAKTHKPYHGYIVPNDINEKFFDDWNNSQIPDHVTIVPILMRDQLLGVLVSIGEKSAFTSASLKFAEKCASQLAQEITSLYSSAA